MASESPTIDLHAQSASAPTGGDLFNTLQIGPRVAFLLTDIAGRRPELDPIAAAMQRAFRTTTTGLLTAPIVNLMETTETLILEINHALVATAKHARFAPTVVGCYDSQLGILAYINAGGQTALFHDSEGTRALPNVSVPLGLFTHLPYDASIQAFEPGAILLVVTKGINDSLESRSQSGPERLIELLESSKPNSANDLCTTVLTAARQSRKPHLDWLPFQTKPVLEDLTALTLIRPSSCAQLTKQHPSS